MTGAILNAIGILLGGIIGFVRTRPLTPQTEAFFKLALGVFTMFYGLQLAWRNLNGTFAQCARQIAIALLAVLLGKLLGRLLRLQAASNHLGQYARKLIESTKPDHPRRFSNGLTACAILFCASPLGLIGAMQDGLTGYFQPLAVKAVMDALAMIGFARWFGVGAMLSALPVFVFQAVIASGSNLYLEPFLRTHGLLESVGVVAGLLLCTIPLVIFDFKKVELADFLPALAVAPTLTWFWK
ncbi:MAG: DUF554 family protein [Verrucomicrobia bacterium]|nr:MAG: DUF554 family protein [Verrucomicrobiota bacterium]